MNDLIERLEGADVGSRDLDRDLMALTYVWGQRHIGATCWSDCCPNAQHLDWVWIDPCTDRWKTTSPEGFEFTTSLDAALALGGRVLDGEFSYDLFHDFGGFNRVKVHAVTDGPVMGEGKADTMPLALCAAILRAVQDGKSSTCGTEPKAQSPQSSNNKGGETNG